MIYLFTLLSNLAFAQTPAAGARAIAVSPDARHALVRVTTGQWFTIANCPVDRGPVTDLTFGEPGTIAGCRLGPYILDTPATRARFEETFATVVKHGSDGPRRSIGARARRSALIATVGGTIILAAWPRLYPAATARESIEAALFFVTGYGFGSAAGLAYMNQNQRGERVVLADPRVHASLTNDAPPLYLINDGPAFDALDRALTETVKILAIPSR